MELLVVVMTDCANRVRLWLSSDILSNGHKKYVDEIDVTFRDLFIKLGFIS